MRIHYLCASKFGNGAKVAEAFKQQVAARDDDVDVRHIRDVCPDRLPAAAFAARIPAHVAPG